MHARIGGRLFNNVHVELSEELYAFRVPGVRPRALSQDPISTLDPLAYDSIDRSELFLEKMQNPDAREIGDLRHEIVFVDLLLLISLSFNFILYTIPYF